MWYDPKTLNGFTFAISGCIHPYTNSNTSAFILVEQELQLIAYKYLYDQETDKQAERFLTE